MIDNRRLMRCVALVGTLSVLSNSCNAQTKTKSSVVRLSLAGERLAVGRADFVKYDPKSKYYLMGEGANWEALGACLLLCPAKEYKFRYLVEARKSQAQRVTLPDLKSGWGVNIGDSSATVRRKLGAAPQRQSVSRDGKAKILSYSYAGSVLISVPPNVPRTRKPSGMNKPAVKKDFDYWAQYTFRDDRLVAIEYHLSDPDYER